MSLTKVSYSMIDGASINVKDYGAVGNGSTDDAAAITLAIAAIPATGGTLYFPASSGAYLVNSTIVVDKNNLTIDFNNQQLSFKSTFAKIGSGDYGIYNVMFAITANTVTCINGYFKQGSFTDSSVFLWFATTCNYSKAINCKFYDIPYVTSGGVYSVLLGVGIQTRAGSTDIQILNCSFYNCAGGVSMQGRNGLIDGCYSYNDSNQVTSLAGSTDQPFGIDGSDFCSITNTKVYRAVGAKVCGANIGANSNTTNFTISNCVVYGLIGGIGIAVITSSYGVVSNNVINGGDYAAVGAWVLARIDVDSSAINFSNNLLRGAPTGSNGRGIDVSTGYNVVSSNTFAFGSTNTVFADVAIQEATSPQTIYISNNTFISANIAVYWDGVTNNNNKAMVLSGNTYVDPLTTPYSGTSLTVNAPLWLSNEKFVSSLITTFAINSHKLFRPLNTYGGYKFPINTAQNFVFYSGEVPTGGNYSTATWSVGDTVYNSAPAVGQPVGWKCTVAGTPGTWVALANL